MGAVMLLVRDLDTMVRYYRDAVGLDVLSVSGTVATLGRAGVPLLTLEQSPDLTEARSTAAGLFHTALLFDTQRSLAVAVHSVATTSPGTFTGSADHLVSQAFYFTDPEGNGVELYWDRDRAAWNWVDGQVQMASLPLDPNAFITEHRQDASDSPEVARATIGHVHLQVGDVATAREFYVGVLGFALTADFGPQAIFVSAGEYHHHMAMNSWNSRGAGPRTRALGLGRVDILVPTPEDLGALGERLTHHAVRLRDDGAALSFDDPWLNLIRVTSSEGNPFSTTQPPVSG